MQIIDIYNHINQLPLADKNDLYKQTVNEILTKLATLIWLERT